MNNFNIICKKCGSDKVKPTEQDKLYIKCTECNSAENISEINNES